VDKGGREMKEIAKGEMDGKGKDKKL